MPLTIEVPDDIAAQLRAAAEKTGEDINHYAVAALREALTTASTLPNFDSQIWWAGLTDAEREAEIATTRRSLADSDAGRVSKATAVYARLRSQTSQSSEG